MIKLHAFSWERIAAAVDAVHQRALRATAALAAAGVPYAVAGGGAVAAWVARVDMEAVRNTKDVDLLVERGDLPRIVQALESAGFCHRTVNGVDLFLDGPEGSVRSAIHLVFANEKVLPDHLLPAPPVTEADRDAAFAVASLESLVRMKLTAMRLKDQVHLIDLLEVGLIDESWLERVAPELRVRLAQVIEQWKREKA